MINKNAKICNLLGLEYPIIQGGMAWVSDASLALAVSQAGGLGVIAAGNAPGEWVREQIKIIKGATYKPYAVNIMLLSPYAEEISDILVEENVPVIITGAGNPGKYMKKWKEAGAKILPVVASLALAKLMQRMGADAVIAEGCEAGGHIGELTTMVLIPDIVNNINIPVVAAGGIYDSRTAMAAFALGAEGVQVGTRFILAKECAAHQTYKDKLVKAKDTDSKVTGRITGHPVRLLRNKLTRKMLDIEYEENAAQRLEEIGAQSLQKAVVDGNADEGSFMAGQVACLLKEELTAKEIIEEIFGEGGIKKAVDNIRKVIKIK